MLEGLCTDVLHLVLDRVRVAYMLRVAGVNRHLRAVCLAFPAAICTFGHPVPAYFRECWRAIQIDRFMYPERKPGLMRILSPEMYDMIHVTTTDMPGVPFAQ